MELTGEQVSAQMEATRDMLMCVLPPAKMGRPLQISRVDMHSICQQVVVAGGLSD